MFTASAIFIISIFCLHISSSQDQTFTRNKNDLHKEKNYSSTVLGDAFLETTTYGHTPSTTSITLEPTTATEKIEHDTTSKETPSETTTPVLPTTINSAVSKYPHSTKTCPESLYYDKVSKNNLTFLETPGGTRTTSREICLCEKVPILRTCTSIGIWAEPRGSCCDTNIEETTKTLSELALNMGNENVSRIIESVIGITEKDADKLLSIDIHLISRILNKASESKNVQTPRKLLDIIDKVTKVGKRELFSSQKFLNSTDTLLYSLDRTLLNFNIDIVTDTNILAFSVNSKLLGAVIKSNGDKKCNSLDVVFLNTSNYQHELAETNFEVAVLLPPDISINGDYYFFTIFCNDALFNQGKMAPVGSWIVSVLFPGDINYTNNSKLKIYFKDFVNSSNQNCNHWKYGLENGIPINGSWSIDGDARKYREGYFLCEFNHTTHFTILVSGSVSDSFILDLITIFGTVLSVIGIIVLFLSALLFKRWRNEVKNKILLNISLCLLLLIILFFISDQINKGPICIIVGIMLHYLVIAQFCWTLVISYCNYHRIIKVTFTKPEHILAKFCLFAWGIPIVIVAITAGINLHTYDKHPQHKSPQICYPKDIYQKLGVILPLSIILTINLALYILIIIKLLRTRSNVRKHKTKKTYEIEKSLILAFFMMCLTWIFGILAAFTHITVFEYLFCTSTTAHGFVIFIFHILDSDSAKKEWGNLVAQVKTETSTKNNVKEQSSTTQTNG